MNKTSPMKKAGLVLAAMLAMSLNTFAQDEDDIQGILELFRSDLNTTKVAVINDALKMNEEEGKAFWPIYREYETEWAKLGDARVDNFRSFAKAYVTGTLDDAAAEGLAERWLAFQQGRIDLWKKYNDQIAEALSPKRAAEFLQIEHQMALLIDINIASQVPLLGSAPSADE